MATILLNDKVIEGQVPNSSDVNVRELSIDSSTGSLWTKLKTGLVRKILAIAVPHANTHAEGQADAITPGSIGAAIADHQHTPADFLGCGDIVASNISDFAPATHSHGIGQVAGLSAQLDALTQRLSALEQEVHSQ
ncbi:hypothetical protein UFOVP917_53 [uncultured Caudovirales phage]|uniref:Uncharacterized protein n=1 Tax=uncultured Caudovirales phage TaxID=2100421 RepID=A0A6J5RTZ4_9CAUD|nr:hypothetical protein UFOVP297_31 [uncultured Caudovirales phage]CAB4171364.1 hypothetical protein UFOVP917_53 [uncultured Caudovirales phage]CAB4183346.1 hypothetical protein UFOVP1094_55 [uncultured Caudovirales phage]CAB4200681.1 hypothetical protein UFOVP1342_55 [uncultured Caudovirales phage]CAB4213352.1 hypothetical protein UFOVP1450_2 [uncultured Caudovirales phage]